MRLPVIFLYWNNMYKMICQDREEAQPIEIESSVALNASRAEPAFSLRVI